MRFAPQLLRPLRVILPLLLIGGALAACDPFKNNNTQFACPRFGGLETATQQVKFRPGEGRDLTDVMYTVKLAGVSLNCEYDNKGVAMTAHVGFSLELGAANPDRNASFEYFVAITDPDSKVLARQSFPVSLSFPPNVGYVEKADELDQRIPLPIGRSASGYQVIVGLQLSEAELEYNRQNATKR
ncbi:MAG TPA: hypothetical protein VGO34_10470 [Alphaproteobacteria bacterium]